MIIPIEFYLNDDVVSIAKSLLGKWLFSEVQGKLTGGIISETEAYKGIEDKASHAFGGRRTKRTEVMYAAGGISYVYLCYGMYPLFNVVTSGKNTPHAVLIRALFPKVGIQIMQERRKKPKDLTSGPGMLCQALGIQICHTGHALTKSPIWLEDHGIICKETDIISGKRVGIAYAQEHAHLPWRFQLTNLS